MRKNSPGRFPRRLRGGGGGRRGRGAARANKDSPSEVANMHSRSSRVEVNERRALSAATGRAGETANRARTGASACYIYSRVSPIFARRTNRVWTGRGEVFGRTTASRTAEKSKSRGVDESTRGSLPFARPGAVDEIATGPNGARHRRFDHVPAENTAEETRPYSWKTLCESTINRISARPSPTPAAPGLTSVARDIADESIFNNICWQLPRLPCADGPSRGSKPSEALEKVRFVKIRAKSRKNGSNSRRKRDFRRTPLSNSGLVRGRAEAAPVARARTTSLLDRERPPPRRPAPPARRSNVSNVRGALAPLAAADSRSRRTRRLSDATFHETAQPESSQNSRPLRNLYTCNTYANVSSSSACTPFSPLLDAVFVFRRSPTFGRSV